MEPRTVSDLPYASALRPHRGELAADEAYDGEHFDDVSFTDAEAANATFLECALTHVTVDRGRLRRAHLRDVWMRDTRFTLTDFAGSGWQDVTVIGGMAAGIQLSAAGLRRVVFRDCKLDSVNFRDAELTDVTFAGCLLRELDLGGATLTRVTFAGSRLEACDFSRATLDAVDLRGAELGLTIGPGSLRGAIISSAQLAMMAPAIAESIGITVSDEEPATGRRATKPG